MRYFRLFTLQSELWLNKEDEEHDYHEMKIRFSELNKTISAVDKRLKDAR